MPDNNSDYKLVLSDRGKFIFLETTDTSIKNENSLKILDATYRSNSKIKNIVTNAKLLPAAALPGGWDFSYQYPCTPGASIDICYNQINNNIGNTSGQGNKQFVNFGDMSYSGTLEENKKTYKLNVNANVFGNSEKNWRTLQDKIRVYSNAVLKVYRWRGKNDFWNKVIRNTDLIQNVDFSNNNLIVNNFASNQGRIELYKNTDSSTCDVLPLYRIINKMDDSGVPALTKSDWTHDVIRDANEIIHDLIQARISNTDLNKTKELNIVLDFSNGVTVNGVTVNGDCSYNSYDFCYNEISDTIKREYNNIEDNVKQHSYYIKINPDLNDNVTWNSQDNIKYTNWITKDTTKQYINRKYSLKTIVLVREILHALGINTISDTSLSKIYPNMISKNIVNTGYTTNYLNSTKKPDLDYNYIGQIGREKYKRILFEAGYPKSMLDSNDLSFIPMDEIGNFLEIPGAQPQDNLSIPITTSSGTTDNIIFPLLTKSVLNDNIERTNVEFSSVIQGILQDLSYNVNYESQYLLKLPTNPTLMPSAILEKGILGDPYVIGLNSTKVWKMPNFDGYARMLKGVIKGKPIIINVETRMNSEKEAMETEEFVKEMFKTNNIDYDKLKNSYDFSCKNEAFMRKLWIKYDNKETIVDMENLSLNNTAFRNYETDEFLSFPKYNIHEATSILIEITNGFEIIVSKYVNPQVKTGFRIKNVIQVSDGEGALWNQLYQEDMKLKSLTNEGSIGCHENRELNQIKREKYWNSEGGEHMNEIALF